MYLDNAQYWLLECKTFISILENVDYTYLELVFTKFFFKLTTNSYVNKNYIKKNNIYDCNIYNHVYFLLWKL